MSKWKEIINQHFITVEANIAHEFFDLARVNSETTFCLFKFSTLLKCLAVSVLWGSGKLIFKIQTLSNACSCCLRGKLQNTK